MTFANLKEKCQHWKANKFLSIKIKQLLNADMDAGAITEDDFLKIVKSCYSTFMEYFDMWEAS